MDSWVYVISGWHIKRIRSVSFVQSEMLIFLVFRFSYSYLYAVNLVLYEDSILTEVFD